MSRELNEMSEIITKTCENKRIISSMHIAKSLYNAGYRKQSEEGAECPTCHGTGRIGTTDWLTKNISKKQLAEEKAKAIAEHEQNIKTEYAKEIFNEIESLLAIYTYEDNYGEYISTGLADEFAELKKKYTEEKE